MNLCRQNLRGTHNNDEAHELRVGPLAAFPRDDVPLLRRADDDLGGVDLLLAQLVVARQLGHGDAVGCKALKGRRKIVDRFIKYVDTF